MTAAKAASRLEAARERLEEGRPRAALSALSGLRVPPPLRAEADLLAAEAWRLQGFFRNAERLYRRILSAAPGDDPVLWVEAALGSAAGLRSLGQARAARTLLARAGGVARRWRLRAFESRLELEDALADRAGGGYRESIRRLTFILRRCERSGDREQAAFALWALGGAHRFSGALAASRRCFERSLKIAGRLRDRPAQGYALFGLGGVTRVMGRLTESARHYARARAYFEGTQDLFGRAYAHCGYANALRQLGRLDEAEAEYLRSRSLYERIGDEVDLAYVEWGLGQVKLRRGRASEAAPFFRRAFSLFRGGGEARGMALAETSLAQALHASGSSRRAEKLLDSAIRRSRRAGLRAHLEIYA